MGESPTDFHREHFESIQALRGIAALFVVLEHVRAFNCGAFGVDIFFCISGFMIMLSTNYDTRCFMRRRLIRIVPLYDIMTLGTFLCLKLLPGMFHKTTGSFAFLVKSLLFLPFDIGEGVIQPLVRVGWTVNCEIFFYLLFFIALRISQKYRGLLCAVFLLATVAAAQLVPAAPVILAFYGSPVMLEFVFGILIYYAARKLYALRQAALLPGFCLPLAMLGAGASLCVLLAVRPLVDDTGWSRPLAWGLPAAVIVICAFLAGLYIRKAPVPLVRLGDASFSLYLLHYYPVLFLDRMVFDFSVFSLRTLAGTAVALAVSVSLALVSREFLEKRLSGCLYGLFTGRVS